VDFIATPFILFERTKQHLARLTQAHEQREFVLCYGPAWTAGKTSLIDFWLQQAQEATGKEPAPCPLAVRARIPVTHVLSYAAGSDASTVTVTLFGEMLRHMEYSAIAAQQDVLLRDGLFRHHYAPFGSRYEQMNIAESFERVATKLAERGTEIIVVDNAHLLDAVTVRWLWRLRKSLAATPTLVFCGREQPAHYPNLSDILVQTPEVLAEATRLSLPGHTADELHHILTATGRAIYEHLTARVGQADAVQLPVPLQLESVYAALVAHEHDKVHAAQELLGSIGRERTFDASLESIEEVIQRVMRYETSGEAL
jgi:hypothetical protein